jgi:hypothetical protein
MMVDNNSASHAYDESYYRSYVLFAFNIHGAKVINLTHRPTKNPASITDSRVKLNIGGKGY